MLAYVFWHWRRTDVAVEEYEVRQRDFQTALSAARASGFNGSFSVGLKGAPWAAGGGEAYEDWYLVDDFGAFDALNETAVTSSRAAPHEAAATAAAGGTAGAYALRLGAPFATPKYAQWFGKPEGMSYAQLVDEIAPAVAPLRAALWSRQMALGPAPEYCLHTEGTVPLPVAFTVIALPLRPVWPVKIDQ